MVNLHRLRYKFPLLVYNKFWNLFEIVLIFKLFNIEIKMAVYNDLGPIGTGCLDPKWGDGRKSAPKAPGPVRLVDVPPKYQAENSARCKVEK